MDEQIIENFEFTYNPTCTIKEGKDSASGNKWLQIGGIALTEGVSKNNNVYTEENLKENNGREFKWLVGHPDEAEEHVVGLGKLKLEAGALAHEGKIRNTMKHPDVVEQVQDGFLGPSIHASVKKATRKEGKIYIEGLSIDGVGLVAFQGVKQASIDYAIAESFDKADKLESSEKDAKKIMQVKNMEEEKPVEKPKAPAEEPKVEEPKAEEVVDKQPDKEEPVAETVSLEEFKKVQEEIKALKTEKKEVLVNSIIECNKELKKEELMKESEEKLVLIKEYEVKLASAKPESHAVVEEVKGNDGIEMKEEEYGVTLTEKARIQLDREMREKVLR